MDIKELSIAAMLAILAGETEAQKLREELIECKTQLIRLQMQLKLMKERHGISIAATSGSRLSPANGSGNDGL